MGRPARILFLGSQNRHRSLMAEALARAEGRDGLEVSSAGLEPTDPDPLTEQVLTEAGIETDGLRPRSLQELQGVPFDLVVLISPEAERACREYLTGGGDRDEGGPTRLEPLFRGAPIHVHWALEPPARPDPVEYRRLREDVSVNLRQLLKQGYLDALLAQKARFYGLLDALQDGIIVHDGYRRLHVLNEAAEQILGVRRQDVLGRDCHEVFQARGLCGPNCSFRDGCHPPERPLQYELAWTTPGGQERQLDLSVAPLELATGGGAGVLAVVRDVTEFRELEWRLRENQDFHGMVGGSRGMRDVFDTIRRISATDYPVLISGESGTGKELVAGAIHAESKRAGGPFVPINCGALPENILESELFGHVRGAFTGAIRDKKGRFELAHRGSLFLDEVGELSPTFQVRLLRVLEEKRITRVGGERTIPVDVRIISATNRELRQLVQQGKFREDLYYRLCVVPIHLPPLRMRPEDLPPLVDSILKRVRREIGKPLRTISAKAMDLLHRHSWPGNVRELINALQFAAVRSAGGRIEAGDLPPEVRQIPIPPGPSPAGTLPGPVVPGGPGRRKLDRPAVEEALARAGGNKVKAARLLGVGRATLYRFLSVHPDLKRSP